MFCEVEYGDFVVWTTHELVMERIKRDEEFYQAGVQKVKQFFCYGILPEIIGKWYTQEAENVQQIRTVVQQQLAWRSL